MSRVWGVVNTLVCNRCGQLFQCRHLRQHCRCHPLSPTPGLEGSSGLVYPCCGIRKQSWGRSVATQWLGLGTTPSVCVRTRVYGQNCPLWLAVQGCTGHTLHRSSHYIGHTGVLCSITSSLSPFPGWLSAKRPLYHCSGWCSWCK